VLPARLGVRVDRVIEVLGGGAPVDVLGRRCRFLADTHLVIGADGIADGVEEAHRCSLVSVSGRGTEGRVEMVKP
jgi:hypothetical protein